MPRKTSVRPTLVAWSLVALSLTACATEAEPLQTGQFVLAGIRGDYSGDQELLWLDLADEDSERLLIERVPEQRFRGAAFTEDGTAIDVLRSAGDLTELLRVPVGGGAAQVLLTFPEASYFPTFAPRTPDGRWLGMLLSEGARSLVNVNPGGEAQWTDLTHLGLSEERTWFVRSANADEYVFYAPPSTWPSESDQAELYLVVTDAEFEVLHTLQSDPGEHAGCFGAVDGRAFACSSTSGADTQSFWIERSQDGEWLAPLDLGPGGAGWFTADSSRFVAAGAVRNRSDPQTVVATIPGWSDPESDGADPSFSPDGRYLLLGAYERTLFEVDTQRESLLGRFVGVDGSEHSRATWSKDGNWIYQGQCSYPTEADTYYCQGSLLSVHDAMDDCNITDPDAFSPPDGCTERPAPAVSVLAVSPSGS